MEDEESKVADSRDMVGAHDAFRLHFGRLPETVRGVAAGDVARASVVGEHTILLADLLSGHHSSEDDHVWPKLHERCPDRIQPLVVTMESQHEHLHIDLLNLAATAGRWKESGGAADRETLADIAQRLDPALREHLALEEAQILRLIDEYLTDEEWKAAVAASAEKLTPERGALALGMVLDTASEEMQTLIREGAPEEFWRDVRPAALGAWQAHAKQVYG
ncbi:hemerythrin domain-containing protein [Micromonospora sp. WMMD1155]|uniref:hemerythrin domain-containing protein n=1 Tax=Micromonospora sp. WMMD1155 TaxID=3016094 RepID=UPI00249C98EF|nr:hemerythrin domain-containing protein [Micromonospora sp. WMMD1155]WFE51246.1 hemerythrin domain-containing protein [Micromonospora sp. WMMD1155]